MSDDRKLSDGDVRAIVDEQRAQADGERKLTDADIKALATELKRQFYENFGKGVWGLVWKALVLAAIALAAYGTYQGPK